MHILYWLLLPLAPVLLLLYLIQTAVGAIAPVAFTRFFITYVPGASWQQGDISTREWQPIHGTAPEVELPVLGQIVRHYFRRAEDSTPPPGELRVVSWNIFLGQNLQVGLPLVRISTLTANSSRICKSGVTRCFICSDLFRANTGLLKCSAPKQMTP
jgi:hypothetical protein